MSRLKKRLAGAVQPRPHAGYVVSETRHCRDGTIDIDAGRIADSWTALRDWYAQRGVPSVAERPTATVGGRR